MKLSLRLAENQDVVFCEALTRSNMSGYLAARGVPWDESRYRASWVEFENWMIVADSQVVGLLRLAREQDALGLRDLQIVPARQGQGVGAWAVQQAQSIAARRGLHRLQLRVYEESPAKALYVRLGFKAESVEGSKLHMALDLLSSKSGMPIRGTP